MTGKSHVVRYRWLGEDAWAARCEACDWVAETNGVELIQTLSIRHNVSGGRE